MEGLVVEDSSYVDAKGLEFSCRLWLYVATNDAPIDTTGDTRWS